MIYITIKIFQAEIFSLSFRDTLYMDTGHSTLSSPVQKPK